MSKTFISTTLNETNFVTNGDVFETPKHDNRPVITLCQYYEQWNQSTDSLLVEYEKQNR